MSVRGNWKAQKTIFSSALSPKRVSWHDGFSDTDSNAWVKLIIPEAFTFTLHGVHPSLLYTPTFLLSVFFSHLHSLLVFTLTGLVYALCAEYLSQWLKALQYEGDKFNSRHSLPDLFRRSWKRFSSPGLELEQFPHLFALYEGCLGSILFQTEGHNFLGY